MSKEKEEKVNPFIATYQKIRRDWGELRPVTRIFKNPKAYSRKEKHKKDYRREEEE